MSKEETAAISLSENLKALPWYKRLFIKLIWAARNQNDHKA